MIEITEGKIATPIKCVIYGSEGIGKSTLASQMPGAVFFDIEGGTAQLNVRRTRPATRRFETFEEILEDMAELIANKAKIGVQTVVFDTVDALEMIVIKNVCKKYKKDGIESFGYGKGYTYVAEDMKRFLEACDAFIWAGINVTLLAHAKITKFEQPDEMGAYDRWSLKLTKNTAPLVKEWADVLLFCNYKTTVISVGEGMTKSKKATGGQRTIYTAHHSCWDAKNRFNLKEELPLEFASIKELYDGEKASISFGMPPEEMVPTSGGDLPFDIETETPDGEPESIELRGLRSLMAQDNVTEDQILKAFKGKYSAIENIEPEVITNQLLNKWSAFIKFLGGTKK